MCVQLFVFNSDPHGRTLSPAHKLLNDMFASICSFTKNDPLCMVYHPYHFVGEVLLHPVYILYIYIYIYNYEFSKENAGN